MKLIGLIKDWWYNIKELYHQSSTDKVMREAFKTIIMQEENDRDSVFNQFNLKSSEGFLLVVQVIDIPEEYQLKGQQWQIMDKLNENSFFVSKYLKEDLLLGYNVAPPEYYHIEDPSSGQSLSMRYIAVWNYTPVLKSKKKIYMINSICSVTAILLILGLTFVFI